MHDRGDQGCLASIIDTVKVFSSAQGTPHRKRVLCTISFPFTFFFSCCYCCCLLWYFQAFASSFHVGDVKMAALQTGAPQATGYHDYPHRLDHRSDDISSNIKTSTLKSRWSKLSSTLFSDEIRLRVYDFREKEGDQ